MHDLKIHVKVKYAINDMYVFLYQVPLKKKFESCVSIRWDQKKKKGTWHSDVDFPLRTNLQLYNPSSKKVEPLRKIYKKNKSNDLQILFHLYSTESNADI